jgi:uncharacterized BrkB/YihY/UPF0761 family membrane protein
MAGDGTTAGPEGRRELMAALARGARRRAEDARAWAEGARGRSPALARVLAVAERDRARYGGLLAGAVAFRLFLWLLPFTLLLVGIGGMVSRLRGGAARVAADLGLQGQLAAVIEEGASQRGWWIAIIVGLAGTLYAGLGAVRALRVSHAAAWGLPPERGRRPARASAALATIGIALIGLAVLSDAVRSRSAAGGAIAILVTGGVYLELWRRVSERLPHRDVPREALVPGALLVAAGALGLQAFTTYVLAAQAERAASVYGAVGTAITLLLWLFILARLMVAAAVLNAELASRRGPAR